MHDGNRSAGREPAPISENVPAPGDQPLPLIDRVLAPFRQFARTASAGGVVLLATTVIALVWANSPWASSYHQLWETTLSLGAGEWSRPFAIHALINDALMAVFFFVVGLEIKREMLAGELSSARTAALPLLAALGGMLVPGGIYALLNQGTPGAPGWGIPMATDIAFALGVLALLGDRVPLGLKVFLAALAIADDIGAVLVIAVFYSSSVSEGALAAAGMILAVAVVMNAAGVRRLWAYGLIGVVLWCAVLMTGVHATIAGVLLSFVIPVRTRLNEWQFLASARRALTDFDAAATVTANDPQVTILSNSEHHRSVEELESLCEQVQPPLIRMEHALHGIVAFGIMPLFALANAGVTLDGTALANALSSPVTLGAALGLVLGKPIGITLFSWLGVKSGLGALPRGVSWSALAGVGVLAGIGFTMALFVAGLAFSTSAAQAASVSSALLDASKIGVFAGSTMAGVAGWLLLHRTLRTGVDGASPAHDSASLTDDLAPEGRERDDAP